MLEFAQRRLVVYILICSLLQWLGCSGPDTIDRAFTSVGAEDAYEQGIAAHRDGDLTGAEAHFRHAIDLNGRYLTAYNGLGAVLLDADRPSEALDVFEQALAIREVDGQALSGKAGALLALGRLDEAVAQAELAIDQGYTLDGSYVMGLALEELGDTERAIELLVTVIREAPERVNVRIALSRMYVATGHAQQALPMMERGARRDPNDPVAWTAFAQLLHDLQIWDRAIEAWQSVIGIDPGNARAMMLMGEAQLMTGNELMAVQALHDAVEADSGMARAYMLLARVELTRGFIDRAGNNIANATRLAPDDLETLVLRGEIYVRQGEDQQAIDTYLRAMEIYPDSLAPVNGLGRLYLDRGEAPTAIEVLSPYEHLATSDRTLAQLLLDAYLSSGSGDTAIDYLQRQIATNPDDYTLLLGLIHTVLASPGQTVLSGDEVIGYAEIALDMSGGFRLEYHLAYIDVLILDGQTRAARAACESGLQEFPNNPDITSRLNSL